MMTATACRNPLSTVAFVVLLPLRMHVNQFDMCDRSSSPMLIGRRQAKPVAITQVGCGTRRGAADVSLPHSFATVKIGDPLASEELPQIILRDPVLPKPY